jgi:hypothetical protein
MKDKDINLEKIEPSHTQVSYEVDRGKVMSKGEGSGEGAHDAQLEKNIL